MGVLEKLGLKRKEVEKPKDPLEGKVAPGDWTILAGYVNLDEDKELITLVEYDKNVGNTIINRLAGTTTYIQEGGGEFKKLTDDYYSGDHPINKDEKKKIYPRLAYIQFPCKIAKFVVPFSVVSDSRIYNGNLEVCSAFGEITPLDGGDPRKVKVDFKPGAVEMLAGLARDNGTRTEIKNGVKHTLSTYQFKREWLDDIVKIGTIQLNNQDLGTKLEVQENNGTVMSKESAKLLSDAMTKKLNENDAILKEYSFETMEVNAVFELYPDEVFRAYMSSAQQKLIEKKALGEYEANSIATDIEVRKAKEKAQAMDTKEPEDEEKKE